MILTYDKTEMAQQAQNLGFNRDNLEKVYRLVEILKFIASNDQLSNRLSLKGGTMLNLTVLSMPRLSLDIDFDFSQPVPKEEVGKQRVVITQVLTNYLTINGYTTRDNQRTLKAADSMTWNYTNSGGTNDSIKIDINYINRFHALPTDNRQVLVPWQSNLTVPTLSPLETFACKISALLDRAKSRDLYDTDNIIKSGLFSTTQERELLRKLVLFYCLIGTKDPLNILKDMRIKPIPQNQILRELVPVLNKKQEDRYFNATKSTQITQDYLDDLLSFTKDEKLFVNDFFSGQYHPETIFDENISQRLQNHPMALLRTSYYAKAGK